MCCDSRPYAGAQDLQELAAFLLSMREAAGHACWHIGDLTWRFFLHSLRYDLGQTVRLWRDAENELQAFAVITPPPAAGTLAFDMQVHPRARGQGLEGQILDWIESFGAPRLITDTGVYESDTSQIAALNARGLASTGDDALLLLRPLAGLIPEPALPPGFCLRAVAGPGEAEQRAAAHQDAFHPSRIDTQAYLRLMVTPGYHAAWDLVAVAPGPTFAAFCTVWLDAVHGVGEFEPVGTRSAFRRQGLARAVLLEGLRRLQECGAESAVVGPIAAGDAAAHALYRDAGFLPVHRLRAFRLAGGPSLMALTG